MGSAESINRARWLSVLPITPCRTPGAADDGHDGLAWLDGSVYVAVHEHSARYAEINVKTNSLVVVVFSTVRTVRLKKD